MFRLIHTELYRCRRSPLLAVTAVFMVVLGCLSAYSTMLSEAMFDRTGPKMTVYCSVYSGAVVIFFTLFFCRDNYDNTIRNRLIVGYSRADIVVSRILTSVIITTAFFFLAAVSYFFVLLIWSCDVYSGIESGLRLPMIAGVYLLGCMWAAMTVLSCTFITRRSLCEIVNVLAVFALMFVSPKINSRLAEPENLTLRYEEQVELSDNEREQAVNGSYAGEFTVLTEEDGSERYVKTVRRSNTISNRDYVGEPLRSVFMLFDRVMPSGQIVNIGNCVRYQTKELPRQLSGPEVDREEIVSYDLIKVFPLYSVIGIAAVAEISVIFYRRKDLK